MSRRERARLVALGFAGGAAAALVVAYVPSLLSRLSDRYYERQVESKSAAAWERRASGLSYEDCRKSSACLGKIVEWPVTRLSDGRSFYASNQSWRIRWSNPAQVPDSVTSRDPIVMIARVAGFDPDAIVLSFIDTPQAAYAGTTWDKKFGYEVK